VISQREVDDKHHEYSVQRVLGFEYEACHSKDEKMSKRNRVDEVVPITWKHSILTANARQQHKARLSSSSLPQPGGIGTQMRGWVARLLITVVWKFGHYTM